MAFRQLFKILFRRTSPVMYATASMLVSCAEINKQNPEPRVQWEPPDFSKLTYDYMIKQSTVEAVNSITQSLTETKAAMLQFYPLQAFIVSIDEPRQRNPVLQRQRRSLGSHCGSKIGNAKKTTNGYLGYMDYVNKMATAATEASYMAGLDNLSTTLAQRMDDALNNVAREVAHNLQLEKEYISLQEECVKKTNIDDNSKMNEDAGVTTENILID